MLAGFASNTYTTPSSMAYCMFIKPAHMHLLGDALGVILDRSQIILPEIVCGRKYACGVSGVNAGQLDVLHDSRNKYIVRRR